MTNRRLAPTALRISLALVFLWFGLLKLIGVSPVVDVVTEAYSIFNTYPVLYSALAIFELAVGAALLFKASAVTASWVALAHLAVATIGVLFSPQAFSGAFPYLSLIGEFVAKNIVLMAAALVVAIEKK